MRVARLLIYEGPEDKLQEQLGASMNEGTRRGVHGVTITCINISGVFLRFVEAVGFEVHAQGYLQGEREPKDMGEP